MEYRPVIVIVAYNRANSLERLLKQVGQAFYTSDDVTLIISIDYHENNEHIIECAEQFYWQHGPKFVKTHKRNLGLRKHILECGDYALEYGSVIILEDDLMIAPYFYEYARQAHNFYGEDERIAGVSLYGYEWNGYESKKFNPIQKTGDVYFGQFSCTCGVSFTSDQWKSFRHWYGLSPEIISDGTMPQTIYKWKQSWGKYFAYYMVTSQKYYLIPYKAVSTVFGEIGTHASVRSMEHQVQLYLGTEPYRMERFEDGVHYDIFFENVDLKKLLSERIHHNDIGIDIYGSEGREIGRNRFLLTTRKLDYKIVDGYALDMRPHEVNVIFGIKGADICLYDTAVFVKNRKKHSNAQLMYDFAGYRPRRAVFYAVLKFIEEHFK